LYQIMIALGKQVSGSSLRQATLRNAITISAN
jgi:hypothetical protein